jgi:hypothetical protein
MILSCFTSLNERLAEIELLAIAADDALTRAADLSLGKTSAEGRIQGNAITRAALVLLCGYFEGFIRDIAEEYIDVVTDAKVPLKNFPDALFCSIVEDMVGILQKDPVRIANFKTVLATDGIVQIKKKLFSKTGGNPSVDTIESVFNGLGIPQIIDTLSIAHFKVDSTFVRESQVVPAMREALRSVIQKNLVPNSGTVDEVVAVIDAKWGPKQKRRKVGYVSQIEELLKKRNRIAHGEGYEQVTPIELRDFTKYISQLAAGLHEHSVVLLVKLTEVAA